MTDTKQSSDLLVLAVAYQDKILNQSNKSSKLFSMLPMRLAQNAKYNFAISKAGGVFAELAEGATVADFGSDTQVSLSLALSNPTEAFHVTDKARAAAAAAGNPADNDDLWALNLVQASGNLAKGINGKLYTGTAVGATEAIIGLNTWLKDDNTVGGINRATGGNEYWKANVFGTSAPLTKALVQTDLATIANVCGERPDVALINPLGFAKLESLYDVNRYYMSPAEVMTGANYGEKTLPTINVNGCTFVEDSDGYANTAGTVVDIYYLNSRHVYLAVLPSADDTPGFASMGIEAYDGFRVFNGGFSYKALGKVSLGQKAVVTSMMQLVMDRPNACGIRKSAQI